MEVNYQIHIEIIATNKDFILGLKSILLKLVEGYISYRWILLMKNIALR